MPQTAEFFIENVGSVSTFYDAINRIQIRDTSVAGKVKSGIISKGMYLVISGEEYRVRKVTYLGKVVDKAEVGDNIELVLSFFAHDPMTSLVGTAIALTENSGHGKRMPTITNIIKRIYNVPSIKFSIILFSIFAVFIAAAIAIVLFFVLIPRSANQISWLLNFDWIV